MARELQHILVRRFSGLGLSGYAASEPLNQGPSGYEFFLKIGQNVHAPADRITNRNIGYTKQADAPVADTKFTLLHYNNPSSGSGTLFGFSNQLAWTQGELTGTWSSLDLPTGATVDADERWSCVQYWDWSLMANGVDPPLLFLGNLSEKLQLWLPPAAEIAPTLTPGTSGSFSGTYQYAYRYVRTADGAVSPTSPASNIQVTDVTEVTVEVPGTARTDFDKVEILRTVDLGSTLQLLTTEDNPGDGLTVTYLDNINDALLTDLEFQTLGSLSADDLQFSMVAVHGDVVYVSGITEEGERLPSRVRMCYPGQPWRFDALDFTDDIDGEIVALASGNEGTYAFTGGSCYLLQPVGVRAVVTTKLDIPGTHGRFTAIGAHGSVYWLNGNEIFAMTRPGEYDSISDPDDKMSSVEPLLSTIQSPETAFLSFHNDFRYLLVGVSISTGTYFDNIIVYDVHRKMWWQLTYGGNYMAQVAREAGAGQNNLVFLTATNGDTLETFDGIYHDVTNAPHAFLIGPTHFQIPNKKRFRRIKLLVTRDSNAQIDLTFNTEEQRTTKLVRFDAVPVLGDQINIDFTMNQSSFVASVTSEAPLCMATDCTGLVGFFRFDITGLFELTSMTVSMQVSPDA